MRGKAVLRNRDCTALRITPAYAGKRLLQYSAGSTDRDHPRLCGEKQRRSMRYRCRPGSPPPMRGKVYVNGLKLIPDGITPAYAGKSDA